MRVPFSLKGVEPFSFSIEGKDYEFDTVKQLAQRTNFAANIEESIVETSDGRRVWLTVAGEEDQGWANGIQRGWYVAQIVDEGAAAALIKAFSETAI